MVNIVDLFTTRTERPDVLLDENRHNIHMFYLIRC